MNAEETLEKGAGQGKKLSTAGLSSAVILFVDLPQLHSLGTLYQLTSSPSWVKKRPFHSAVTLLKMFLSLRR